MKNIQVIDSAQNTTYSIYAVSERTFKLLFPEEGQDIEFAEDAIARMGTRRATPIFRRIWRRKLSKASVSGIHGTLFFELDYKREFYPRKREADSEDLRYVNGRWVLPRQLQKGDSKKSGGRK